VFALRRGIVLVTTTLLAAINPVWPGILTGVLAFIALYLICYPSRRQ
jgi:hypothetical protein